MTFTIVGNKCPLTRITSTKVVPTKETSTKSVATPTQGILVYSRRPKATRSVGSTSKVKIVEPKTSNSKEPKQSWGSTIYDIPSSYLNDYRFRNDHIAKIMGYGDYQIGNVTISRVYYVEGLGLVRGLLKLKYQKDHLCSACALGKSKKHSHKPKAKYFIQEKLYLLHMDLCGPMRDEVPEFVIKFLNMIQVRLNATIPNIRTDNGTEFVKQTLKAYYEEVGISHQTSVARTPQ
ncbi:retrovirus-related pol polyprotein from transposon TNT 1-94 [Tanacetum coccineum]|uniref:Retrovirus-related pol polyprotein from transposon TNT 1-94 n=1 Tax=Tanacetum coccineum TaxID=301880 RepID=A0ABQ5DCK7_9ASTR